MDKCKDCKTKGDYNTCIACLQKEVSKDNDKEVSK